MWKPVIFYQTYLSICILLPLPIYDRRYNWIVDISIFLLPMSGPPFLELERSGSKRTEEINISKISNINVTAQE